MYDMTPKYTIAALQSEGVLSVYVEWTSPDKGTERTRQAIAKLR